MLFEGRYKTQDHFRYFLQFFFSVPSFIFSKNGRGGGAGIFLFTLKGWFKLFIIFIQRMVSLTVILQYKMLLVRLHIYIDILKLKAYKLFENSDNDLSWLLFFKEANLFLLLSDVFRLPGFYEFMKFKRPWEYNDDILSFCKIFVPRSEGPPLKSFSLI